MVLILSCSSHLGPVEPIVPRLCLDKALCFPTMGRGRRYAFSEQQHGEVQCRSACRCNPWAIRLLRDSHHCHMTLAGGFRCHGDISFFLHQGWLVIWVKVILLPPSLYSPPRLGITPPSDKVTVNTLLHTSPTDKYAPHTVLRSSYFLLLFRLLRNS